MPLILVRSCLLFSLIFFFNDPATTEIYTLSLHDALPICAGDEELEGPPGEEEEDRHRIGAGEQTIGEQDTPAPRRDRKSTRLNSSHVSISYAVFCLKKKKKKKSKKIKRKRRIHK